MNKKRLQSLKKILDCKNLDCLLLQDPIDIFYLTGLKVSKGELLVFENRPILFLDGRYLNAAKKKLKIDLLPLEENHLKEAIFKNVQKPLIKIGFDAAKLSYLAYEDLQKKFKTWGVSCNLIGIDQPLKEMRMIKDENEINLMKKAARLNYIGFEHIKSILKEGISEKEVALAYEVFMRKQGAEKLSFDPIICFGKNTAYPHHTPGDTKLQPEDFVLVDIGVHLDNYASDMTRMVFLKEPNDRMALFYKVIREVQKKACELCKPGVSTLEIDQFIRNYLKNYKLDEYFIHATGHGIGIEVHEYPRLNKETSVILQENMVVTIEPGLYEENVGGVRWEDMIVITRDGCVNFYETDI